MTKTPDGFWMNCGGNLVWFFYEERLPLAQRPLSDYSVQNEETRLPEEAGDRSGGGTDDSDTPG